MTKGIIVLSALGVGTTIVIAAPLTMTLGRTSEEVKKEFKKPNWKGVLPKLVNSKDIKNSYQSIACINDYFKNITWSNVGADISVLSESFNFNPSQTKGCLIVDYYEQKYGDKWWGEFKLSWSLIDDQQHGFVTVVQATTRNTKLTIDSAIYILGSKTDGGWEVKYNKDKKEEVLEDSKFTNLIPQPGNLIKDEGYQSVQNWGFNPKPTNACDDNGCAGEVIETKKSSALWKISYDSGGESVENLFTNLKDWFENSFSLESKVDDLISSGMNFKLTHETKTITEEDE